jgi:hypothetical protein
VATEVLVHGRRDWARKCWSARGMSGHKSAGPLKIIFYPSSTGTLTFAKSIETCVESNFATERIRSAIAGRPLLFW